jgi:hypothetical protein
MVSSSCIVAVLAQVSTAGSDGRKWQWQEIVRTNYSIKDKEMASSVAYTLGSSRLELLNHT